MDAKREVKERGGKGLDYSVAMQSQSEMSEVRRKRADFFEVGERNVS